MEKTLVIVKPDAVCRGYTGKILGILEENGLKLRALKMMQMDKQQAKGFYKAHKERDFYDNLASYMSSGPMVAILLEGEKTISKVRQLLGATDPAEAEPDLTVPDLRSLAVLTGTMA